MQRRDFSKLASLSAAGVVASSASASAAPARKPNVIFIISDQHRTGLTKRERYPLDTSPALDRARGWWSRV
jgi:hypothetical protein